MKLLGKVNVGKAGIYELDNGMLQIDRDGTLEGTSYIHKDAILDIARLLNKNSEMNIQVNLVIQVDDLIKKTKSGSIEERLKEFKNLEIPIDDSGIFIKNWHHSFSSGTVIQLENVMLGVK